MSIKGELTVDYDDKYPLYKWDATFKCEYGTFYKYGQTKREVLNKIQITIKDLMA